MRTNGGHDIIRPFFDGRIKMVCALLRTVKSLILMFEKDFPCHLHQVMFNTQTAKTKIFDLQTANTKIRRHISRRLFRIIAIYSLVSIVDIPRTSVYDLNFASTFRCVLRFKG